MSEVERLCQALLETGSWRYGQAMVAGVFYDGPSELLDALLTAVREEHADTIAREIRANIPHDAHPDYAEGMDAAARLVESMP